MADLDEIMSGSGGDSVVEAPVQEVEQSQPRDDGRDEQGRFVAQQQEVQSAQPEHQEQRPPDGYIPIQALDDRLAKERERSDAALRQQAEQFQRQMEMLRQPPKPQEPVTPPDYFENPDAAVDFRLKQAMQPVQQNQREIVENFSKMMAADKFGEDVVQAAMSELTSRVNANPQSMRFDYERIMASPHPYGELVKWHKTQSALNTYGDDPTAYREKLRAEIMAEMQGQQQQQAAATPPPVMPTSFAGARSSGPSATPAYSGPRPLSDLMGR